MTKDALTGVTKFSFVYNSKGQISSITDQFGNATTFGYSGASVVINSPYNQSSTLALDTNGHLASVNNPNSEVYTVTSNSAGFLQTFTKPMGQQSRVTFSSGLVVSKDEGAGGDYLSFTQNTDQSSGIQTVTSTTALGILVTYHTSETGPTNSSHSINSPDGGVDSYVSNNIGNNTSADKYGGSGSYTSVNDPRFGNLAPYAQSSSYLVPNSNINILSATNKNVSPANPVDPLSFTSLTTSTTLQNDPTRVFTSTYNAQARQLTSISPIGRKTSEVLNSNAQVSSIQVGDLIPFNFSYDSRGRLIAVLQASRQSSLSYDQFGNVASSTNALNQTTKFAHDLSGRVTSQTLADSSVIAMSYDKNGNLISLTPPHRPAHNFSYNLMELVSEYLPPNLTGIANPATFYSYNLGQQVTNITRPDGLQIGFNYNAVSGLLASITTLGGNYTYAYKQNSDLVSTLTSPDNEVLNYTYAGEVPVQVTSSGPINSLVQFNFNSDGSLGQIGVGAGSALQTQTRAYDKDGLLIGAGNEVITRNNVGAVSATGLGKISEVVRFNNFGEIISDEFKFKNREIFERNYSRDKLGRITGFHTEDHDDRNFYKYGSQGRLIKAGDHRYKYDENGNRLSAIYGDHEVRGKYDDQDRLVKYGNLEFRYNANGDLTEKIEHKHEDFDDHWFGYFFKDKDDLKITEYVYDVFGNLKSVKLPDGKLIEYIVDGQNRRVGKKINGKLVRGWVYQDQTQLVGELDSEGKLVKQFVYGSKTNVPDYMFYQSKEYRIISDQVGTPKLVVDSVSGNVLEEIQIDEFGFDQDIDGNHIIPFGFAGGIYDSSTGFVRMGARDYLPEVGRWVNKDPLGFGGGSTNLFSYVASDPVNFKDPSGTGPVAGLVCTIAVIGNATALLAQLALLQKNFNLDVQLIKQKYQTTRSNPCPDENQEQIDLANNQQQYVNELKGIVLNQIKPGIPGAIEAAACLIAAFSPTP